MVPPLQLPVPKYTHSVAGGSLHINTSSLDLTFTPSKATPPRGGGCPNATELPHTDVDGQRTRRNQGGIRGATAASCCAACRDDPECVAFVFASWNVLGKPNCWPMAHVAKLEQNEANRTTYTMAHRQRASGFAAGEVTVKFDMADTPGAASCYTARALPGILPYTSSPRPDADNVAHRLRRRAGAREGRWASGDTATGNLGGTISSWNEVDPKNVKLQPGLLSRDGWTLVADGDRPLFDTETATPWLGKGPWAKLPPQPAADEYLFACGLRFAECLASFAAISGPVSSSPFV